MAGRWNRFFRKLDNYFKEEKMKEDMSILEMVKERDTRDTGKIYSHEDVMGVLERRYLDEI